MLLHLGRRISDRISVQRQQQNESDHFVRTSKSLLTLSSPLSLLHSRRSSSPCSHRSAFAALSSLLVAVRSLLFFCCALVTVLSSLLLSLCSHCFSFAAQPCSHRTSFTALSSPLYMTG